MTDDPWVSQPWFWQGMKMARALQHLKTIKEEFAAREDYGVLSDFKSEPGYLIVKAYFRGEIDPFWSVMVGEILYQFRSALDHLACKLTEDNGERAVRGTSFPIALRRHEFRHPVTGDLNGRTKERIGRMAEDKRTLIEAEQPFQGKYGSAQDDPLWWLSSLSNYDRHKFLHLVRVAVLGGHDEFIPQSFADRYFTQVSVSVGTIEGETEVSRYRIDPAAYEVEPPVTVQVESKRTFAIAFDQEGPWAGRPVISTLGAIGSRISEIIMKLDPS